MYAWILGEREYSVMYATYNDDSLHRVINAG